MKIWIDADAAPFDVKQIVFRASKRLRVETLLVANRFLETPVALTTVRSIQVADGADQADRYIVTHGEAGDLAITADLPLAGQLVDKGLFVIDPRGDEYSPNTVATRLSMRNFLDDLRGSGMVTGGSPPYGETDKKAFAATFDRLLTKAIRRAKASESP
ncbi:YaiI/YqxD family protein [Novipirellula artificiosorum]|uniref:YaiI/YqxD family protein n=1 Tax=Novipirellula artificiosorum TaxID=2528016 RepID=UPI0011B5246E|nr:YaiI/YqxD family protein [Novipirellula artificiosorum]